MNCANIYCIEWGLISRLVFGASTTRVGLLLCLFGPAVLAVSGSETALSVAVGDDTASTLMTVLLLQGHAGLFPRLVAPFIWPDVHLFGQMFTLTTT